MNVPILKVHVTEQCRRNRTNAGALEFAIHNLREVYNQEVSKIEENNEEGVTIEFTLGRIKDVD